MNPEAHYKTTGPEIWLKIDEKVDVLIWGNGTHRIITGVVRYLKEKNESVKIIGVEQRGSVFMAFLRSGGIHEGL